METPSQKIPAEVYLMKMSRTDVEPNFYMSLAWLSLQEDITCYFNPETEVIWAEDEDGLVFPPVLCNWEGTQPIYGSFSKVWTNMEGVDLVDGEFFDWEYVYDPRDFRNMTGGKWEKFRKNCHKWPKRNPGWRVLDYEENEGDISYLVAKWFEEAGDSLADAEFIANYTVLARPTGVNVQTLYNNTGKLVAVNFWDVNWKFINYRFCIVDSSEPFASEFARWLFYDSVVRFGKLVNDGGTVGSASLERFKDSMNPRIKRKRMCIT